MNVARRRDSVYRLSAHRPRRPPRRANARGSGTEEISFDAQRIVTDKTRFAGAQEGWTGRCRQPKEATMATLTKTPHHSVVILTAAQREELCHYAWTLLGDCGNGNFDLTMGGCRIFEALDWRSGEPERDSYELPVDERVSRFVRDHLAGDVDDYRDNPGGLATSEAGGHALIAAADLLMQAVA